MFGREFWVTTVAEYEGSKLTQEMFAARRDISVSTLRSWIYRLRRERMASVSLVPVRVVASPAPEARGAGKAAASAVGSASDEIVIELRSGIRLRICGSVDVEQVAALVQRLG